MGVDVQGLYGEDAGLKARRYKPGGTQEHRQECLCHKDKARMLA